MENDKKAGVQPWQAHKKLALGLTLGLAVFFNCFGFPVYNWNKAWPLTITAMYIVLLPCCAVFIGGSLASLIPEKSLGTVLFLTAILTCAGLGCRFLLEFGEVSNTYNFTLPNILFHLLVSVGCSSLAWFRGVKQSRTEG